MSQTDSAVDSALIETGTRLYCRVLCPGSKTSVAALAAHIGFAECGAIVTFEGLVRETEAGRKLEAIDYEFHPVMAQSELYRLCEQALEQFDIEQIACEHCTGRVAVQQPSIVIAIGAAHRAAAFQACQYLLDQLKRVVPIWKSPVYTPSDFSHQGGGNSS